MLKHFENFLSRDHYYEVAKELEDEQEKIRNELCRLVGLGYHIKVGDRVLHRIKRGDNQGKEYYGTVTAIRPAQWRDVAVDWDDKDAPNETTIRHSADCPFGFEILRLDVKDQYDKLRARLHKSYDISNHLIPTYIKCIESNCGKFRVGDGYKVTGKNSDGEIFVVYQSYSHYMEEIRLDNNLMWRYENHYDHNKKDEYALFEDTNKTIKEYIIMKNKENIQRRFDL